MDSIGAEVGQKMRSAIKAKLTELNCYVDDELPDYIMVMVANKRSKSQMSEDLNLFLTTKTTQFVDWLHIVLKKLKEVTVTNPEVYKKVSKRKLDDPNTPSTATVKTKVKKEKKEKKAKKSQSRTVSTEGKEDGQMKLETSLTDDLPLNVAKVSEQRKVVILKEDHIPDAGTAAAVASSISKSAGDVEEDNFDIPPLSEVSGSNNNEKELEDIEKKIRSVKSRLGMLVESDSSDDDCINIKAEPDELFNEKKENRREEEKIENGSSRTDKNRKLSGSVTMSKTMKNNSPSPRASGTPPREQPLKKSVHERITFRNEDDNSISPPRSKVKTPTKRRSVMDRLGKRQASSTDDEESYTPKKSRGNSSVSENKRRDQEERYSKQSSSRISREDDRYSKHSSSKDGRDEDRRRKRETVKGDVFSRISAPNSRNRNKESVRSRLGVQSKVSIPGRGEGDDRSGSGNSEDDGSFRSREVASVIKIKPRIIPTDAPQANKNLLLKAVADAQRSVTQTPTVGNNIKPDALYTKRYKEQHKETASGRKLSELQKNKIKNIIIQVSRSQDHCSSSSDEETEYVPKPLRNPSRASLNYTPSSKLRDHAEPEDSAREDEASPQSDATHHQFIVTLNGPDISGSSNKTEGGSAKSRMEGRRTPSPIVFDKIKTKTKATKINVPDRLPVVHASPSLKNKERCKYWPGCRQGDKCEFLHPSSTCEQFPNCKFGDKCLYTHPICKFLLSCTRRDCPYSHAMQTTKPTAPKITASLVSPSVQICKFYPKCANLNCPFYHPKSCKFGKFCKNQNECTFAHPVPTHSKSSLTWRPK